jgi:hypothetical protein
LQITPAERQLLETVGKTLEQSEQEPMQDGSPDASEQEADAGLV